MLELANDALLAAGARRYIYQHPHDRALLVKVMRADNLQRRWHGARWYRRLARTGPYVSYLREFREYLASLHYAPDQLSPLAAVVGLVDTDLGPGLVSEKILDEKGGIAPTLAELASQRQLPGAIEQALQQLLDALLRHNVIANDLHAANLVYGRDSRGGDRIVMIDGFGEKNAVPLCSISRRYNARHTRRKFAALRQELDTLQRQASSPGVEYGQPVLVQPERS